MDASHSINCYRESLAVCDDRLRKPGYRALDTVIQANQDQYDSYLVQYFAFVAAGKVIQRMQMIWHSKTGDG
jgi:hypothetical protein